MRIEAERTSEVGQSGGVATLVTFHAHPDDEALLTAGVMAKAASEGHRVVLVVATHGEAGEVDPTVLDGDDLGERRTSETSASAEALGVHRVVFLGYRDSGLEGDREGGFCQVSVDEVAHRLADILREEAADVLTTYDPRGGYGHPDHVQVHAVGARAAALAATPIVLEATINRDLLVMARELAPTLGFELPEDFVLPDTSDWFVPATEITHTVDVSAFLDQKRASMRAHATQATSASSNTRSLEMFLALPDEWYAIAFGAEWFVDRSAPPEASFDDVFATLERPDAGR
jgi:LmbE family N-acetylglucosaminyl deacetylase